MACLAIALEDATSRCDTPCSTTPAQSTESITVSPAFTEGMPHSSEDIQRENDLFRTNFADRFGHFLNATLFSNEIYLAHHMLSDDDLNASHSFVVFGDSGIPSLLTGTRNTRPMSTAFSPFIGTNSSLRLKTLECKALHSTMFQTTSKRPLRPKFLGAVVDTGAAR